MVASTATIALTFGSRHVGEVGPAPRCMAPVTATATVTGTAGAAAPTGNVTLAIATRSTVLDPFPHTLGHATGEMRLPCMHVLSSAQCSWAQRFWPPGVIFMSV